MLTELRRYTCQSGRMRDMHSRMRDILLPMFKLHGVPRPLAIWETQSPNGDGILTWMLNWPGFDVRAATWAAFRPFWEAVKKERGEAEFVTRTDLSLIFTWPTTPLSFAKGGDICEALWVVQPRVGYGAAFRAAFFDTHLPILSAAGATNVIVSDYLLGPLPQSLALVTWPDPASRTRGMAHIAERSLQAVGLYTASYDRNITGPGSWEILDRATYLDIWGS